MKKMVILAITVLIIIVIPLNRSFAAEVPICTAIFNQWEPTIYNDKIVWGDFRNGNWDIYMYNLSTSTETPICTQMGDQWAPIIDGDKIVWQDCRSGDYNIYMYNLATHTETPICVSSGEQSRPSISGDKIVWRDMRNGDWDIYMYNLSTSTETPICTLFRDQTDPVISGNKMVWWDYRNLNWDIYMYDLSTSTETAICTQAAEQARPTIFSDKIIWDDSRNGNFDLYMYDLSTSTETAICTQSFDQVNARIYGDEIVWEDYRNVNRDIYKYNLTSHVESPVITQIDNQWAPSIFNDKIVWSDGRNGFNNDDIYIKIDDVTPPSTSITIDPLSPDGQNGWFITDPSITLIRNEPGNTYYRWDSGVTNTYTLPIYAPEGEHALYYWSTDITGNKESVKSQSIKVDTTLPDTTLTKNPPFPDAAFGWYKTVPTLSLTPSEPGTTYYRWGSGSDETFTVPFKAIEGENTFWYWTVDPAGNSSLISTFFKVDSVPPVIDSFSINEDAAVTSTTSATLNVSSSGSPVYMRFADTEEDLSSAVWQDYNTTASYELTAGFGPKQVWAETKDMVGNVSSAVSDTVNYQGQDQKLIAEIIYPPNDHFSCGQINVIGTARSSEPSTFARYVLEYQKVNVPQPSWSTIYTSAKPAENSTLGLFSTAGLNGPCKLRLSVYSKSGNLATDKVLIHLDNEKPKIGSVSPTAGLYHRSPTSEQVVISDVTDSYSTIPAGDSNFRMKLDDMLVSASYNPLTQKIIYNPGWIMDGYHTAYVEVFDELGNKNSKTWGFYVDNMPPWLSILQPLDYSFIYGKTAITGWASDDYLKSFKMEYRKSPTGSWATAFTGSTEKAGETIGTWSAPTVKQTTAYDLRLSGSDKAGNAYTMDPVKTVYVVPAKPSLSPICTVTAPMAGPFNYVSGVVPILGNAADPDFSKFDIKWEQTSPSYSAGGTIATSYIPVFDGTLANWSTAGKNGTFKLTLTVYNSLNSPVSTFTLEDLRIDNGKPVIGTKLIPSYNSYTSSQTPTISIVALDPEPSKVGPTKSGIEQWTITAILDGNWIFPDYDPISGTVSFAPFIPLDRGTHNVSLTVEDLAGNSISKNWSFNVESGELSAQILKPEGGQLAAGNLPITGVATARNFYNYTLKARALPSGGFSTFYTGTKPVPTSSGTLATWSTSGKNGPYELLLTVTDKAGNTLSAPPVSINLDNLVPKIDSILPLASSYVKSPTSSYIKACVSDPIDKTSGFFSGIDSTKASLKIVASYLTDDSIYQSMAYTSTSPTGGYFTCTPSGELADGANLKDGSYTSYLTIYDQAKNSSIQKVWPFTIDNQVPTSQITLPEEAQSVSSGKKLNVTGDASDQNISSFKLEYKKSSASTWSLLSSGSSTKIGTLGTWSVPTLTTTTSYDLRLTVKDKAANESTSQRGILIVPSSLPNPVGVNGITSPVSLSSLKGSFPILGTATGDDFTSYLVTYRQTNPISGSLTTLISSTVPIANGTLATFPAGKNGTFDITLTAKRTGGDETYPISIVADNIVPVVKATDPKPSPIQHYATSSPQVAFGFTESGSGMDESVFLVKLASRKYDLTLLNHTYSYPTLSVSLENLADGSHTISLEGKDMAGNAFIKKSLSLVVDTNDQNAPTPPGLSISNLVDGSFLKGVVPVIGTAFDQNILNYVIEYSVSGSGSWSKIYSSSLSVIEATLGKWLSSALNGLFDIRVTLTDKAKNTQTQTISSITIDNRAPTTAVSLPVSNQVVSGSYSIWGTAADDNLSTYDVEVGMGTSPVSYTTVASDSSSVTGGELGVWDTSLWDNGTYTVRLTANDKSGNSSVKKTVVKVSN